jgi:hypothetical protein
MPKAKKKSQGILRNIIFHNKTVSEYQEINREIMAFLIFIFDF